MIKYHFFGKETGIESIYKERNNFESAMAKSGFLCKKNQLPRLLVLNQIHGNRVEIIDCEEKVFDEKNLPAADGIICNLTNIALAIVTADCAPVLFFDQEKQIIGAAHAGWKGAKAGILEKTIAEMKKLGAEKISAIIGPMIQQHSYQVSADFVDDFLAEDAANQKFFLPSNASEYNQQDKNKSQRQDLIKSLFDLNGYVKAKLEKFGVYKISDDKIDTYSMREKFHSYRRSCHLGQKTYGQNIALISIL